MVRKLTRDKWQQRSRDLRILLRGNPEENQLLGNFIRVYSQPKRLTYLYNRGFDRIIGTLKLAPNGKLVLRYRPKSIYAGLLASCDFGNMTTLPSTHLSVPRALNSVIRAMTNDEQVAVAEDESEEGPDDTNRQQIEQASEMMAAEWAQLVPSNAPIFNPIFTDEVSDE